MDTLSAGLASKASWLSRVLALREERIAAIAALEAIRETAVFVLWNIDALRREDFVTLADFLEVEAPDVDIDLVLLSPGGSGEAGYRIGHAFQQWATRRSLKFSVVIPLYAKSAATILALGAHEIVMGLQSEIGPIDPQIPELDRDGKGWRYVPAMALMDGLKLVSEHVEQLPEMRRFFEELLKGEQLSLKGLGVVERARETGKQYGEMLLTGGMIDNAEAARAAADRLTDFYKFHGHPVDSFDAEENLSLKIHHSSGEEWATIKLLRDAFQRFVGRPDLLPGAIVTTAIESRSRRSWRVSSHSSGLSQRASVRNVFNADEHQPALTNWSPFGR